MPLIYTALLPHPPELLAPAAGGPLEKTRAAYARIAADLEERKPDVLVIVSSHGEPEEELFLLNVSDTFQLDLAKYGIKRPLRNWRGNMDLSSHIRTHSTDSDSSVQMTTIPLDLASAVPSAMLGDMLPETITLLPVYTSGLSAQQHVDLGAFLRHEFVETNLQIAVIASAELSSTASKEHPDYQPEGETFNQLVISALEGNDIATMMQIDQRVVEKAATCGYEPLLVIMGMLAETGHTLGKIEQEFYEGTVLATASCVIE